MSARGKGAAVSDVDFRPGAVPSTRALGAILRAEGCGVWPRLGTVAPAVRRTVLALNRYLGGLREGDELVFARAAVPALRALGDLGRHESPRITRARFLPVYRRSLADLPALRVSYGPLVWTVGSPVALAAVAERARLLGRHDAPRVSVVRESLTPEEAEGVLYAHLDPGLAREANEGHDAPRPVSLLPGRRRR